MENGSRLAMWLVMADFLCLYAQIIGYARAMPPFLYSIRGRTAMGINSVAAKREARLPPALDPIPVASEA